MKTIQINAPRPGMTGQHSVWFKHEGQTLAVYMSEDEVDSLLSLRQKEAFFTGQFRFKVTDGTISDLLKKYNLTHS